MGGTNRAADVKSLDSVSRRSRHGQYIEFEWAAFLRLGGLVGHSFVVLQDQRTFSRPCVFQRFGLISGWPVSRVDITKIIGRWISYWIKSRLV